MTIAIRRMTVVSMGETHSLIGPADTRIENGEIIAAGALTGEQLGRSDELSQAPCKLKLPCMVNAHPRAPASLSASRSLC